MKNVFHKTVATLHATIHMGNLIFGLQSTTKKLVDVYEVDHLEWDGELSPTSPQTEIDNKYRTLNYNFR